MEAKTRNETKEVWLLLGRWLLWMVPPLGSSSFSQTVSHDSNGEMTESATASVPALFIPRSWLRRRNVNKQTKKVIGSLRCIVINTSWLTRSGSLRAEDRIQNQEYRSQLLYSITRIGLSIAVDNLLQVSHLMIASNMVSSEVSIISRINCYLDRSTVLCCVSAWCDIYVHQDIWHQEGRAHGKHYTLFTCTSAASVYC